MEGQGLVYMDGISRQMQASDGLGQARHHLGCLPGAVGRGASGGRQELQVESSGAIQLVPQGGAMVVPHPEGLILMRLPGQPQRRQMLPGNRDLSSFCASGGRALMVRRRPDFSRSLELVEPG